MTSTNADIGSCGRYKLDLQKVMRLFTLRVFLLIGIMMVAFYVDAQEETEQRGTIHYSINSNVGNSEEAYFQEIYATWQVYLDSGVFARADNQHWDQSVFAVPDYSYINLLYDLNLTLRRGDNINCTLLGLIPVKGEHYLMKTAYNKRDSTSQNLEIKYIVSVYIKKVDDQFVFVNSTQYWMDTYDTHQVGSVQYIVHPLHDFNEGQAQKMDQFNTEMAIFFDVEPISFYYAVANDTKDLGDMMGLEFFPYSYNPVQSGGMADGYNRILYAGNNSEYYPHELVHLYTNQKYRGQQHQWVDEGIAAMLGGSTGYKIEWHIQKLKEFLKANPDYDMSSLNVIDKTIPNGEYTTDFMYAIGGFLMQQIYQNEGKKGLFDALQSGRSEDEYFALLEDKLCFKPDQFGHYIKEEMKKLPELRVEQMEELRY